MRYSSIKDKLVGLYLSTRHQLIIRTEWDEEVESDIPTPWISSWMSSGRVEGVCHSCRFLTGAIAVMLDSNVVLLGILSIRE
jgi:hypothetical protein